MNKQMLIKHLRALANYEIEPVESTGGLCWEIESEIDYAASFFELVQVIINVWPKGSGCMGYPVSVKGRCPEWLFYFPERYGFTMWGRDEYGSARRELCGYVADELEKMWEL